MILAGGCIKTDSTRNFTRIWVGVYYLSSNASASHIPLYTGFGYVVKLMRNETDCDWDTTRCWWEGGKLTIELRDSSLEVIDTINKKLRDRDRYVVKTATGRKLKTSFTPAFHYYPESYNVTDAKTFREIYITRSGKTFKSWGTINDPSQIYP